MNGQRIGASLRALRHRARLRQEDVARAAGVSRTTVARIEAGDVSGITVGTLTAVFEAVGARRDPAAVARRGHGSAAG